MDLHDSLQDKSVEKHPQCCGKGALKAECLNLARVSLKEFKYDEAINICINVRIRYQPDNFCG